MVEAVKHDVSYTLTRCHRGRHTIEIVGSFPLYTEAFELGMTFHHKRGYHMQIQRTSTRG
jgi:hypothetical protein